MRYPKYNVYQKLYKKYFHRSPKELLCKVDLKKGNNILDICGGNGRLSFLAKNMGANVTYLDQEIDMIPFEELNKEQIEIVNSSINDFVDNYDKEKRKPFDSVFCQQAVTYWIKNIDINKFSSMIKKDGYFVFNTFNTKPSIEPMLKEYELDGLKYVEISQLIDNKVHHIQTCSNMEPHITIFDWVSEEEFFEILNKNFFISIIKDKTTSIYVCKKK